MPKKAKTTMKPLNPKTLGYKQPLQHKVIEAAKPEKINPKEIFEIKSGTKVKRSKNKIKKRTSAKRY
tara:strand:+ start:283 stop:483 length:201 start_codon:yes stop_codon:yes gene_type:complete